MTKMRNNPPKELAGLKVLAVRDYTADTRTDLISGESFSGNVSVPGLSARYVLVK